MNSVVQNDRPEQRLQRPPIYDIARTAKMFVDIELHSGVLKNANGTLLLKLYQNIDIAPGTSLAPCHRTEDRGVCHPQPPQISLVSAESLQNVMEVKPHIRP